MPASSGRVRMPHNNRMHSSATLKMTGIWKNTIGYDPYAAESEEQAGQVSASAHEQAQGLMALAKLSNKTNDVRGACKKCGMLGHLTFQCRNFLDAVDQKPAQADASSSDSSSESESETEADRRRRRSAKKKAKKSKREHRDRSTRRSRSGNPSPSPSGRKIERHRSRSVDRERGRDHRSRSRSRSNDRSRGVRRVGRRRSLSVDEKKAPKDAKQKDHASRDDDFSDAEYDAPRRSRNSKKHKKDKSSKHHRRQ